MSKIRVAVDLDGVVYNWGDTVRYLIKHKYDIDLPASTHWHFVQENVPEEAWKWLWASGEEMGMFRYGSLIKGAVEGLKTLSEDGYSLEIATHRPAWAIPDTCLFIARLPNVWSGIHLNVNEEPKSMLGCDIYLDDRPSVAEDVVNAGKQIVVFDQPWNQNLELSRGYWRAFGWENVPEVIADAADYVLDRKGERELVDA